MNRARGAVGATAMALSGAVSAQTPPAAAPPPPDFSEVEIKTTDLGDKVYMLEGQGGNITVAVTDDAIIMATTPAETSRSPGTASPSSPRSTSRTGLPPAPPTA